MKKLHTITATLILAAMGASATVIVDYNPPATRLSGRDADVDTTNGDTWNFSDTTALFPASDGQNDTIYGGVITTWFTAQAHKPSLVQVADSGAQIQVGANTGFAGTQTAKGAFVWNQADFLNGADSGIISLGAGSSISMAVTEVGATEYRAVLNQGGTYYVSESSATDTSALVLDPTTVNWAVLDTTDYTYGSFSSLALDDVQGVGVWFDQSRDDNLTRFRVTDMQVNAIPEPASFGLVTALGGGIIFLRRWILI